MADYKAAKLKFMETLEKDVTRINNRLDQVTRDISSLTERATNSERNIEIQAAESKRLEAMIIHNRETIDRHHWNIQTLEI